MLGKTHYMRAAAAPSSSGDCQESCQAARVLFKRLEPEQFHAAGCLPAGRRRFTHLTHPLRSYMQNGPDHDRKSRHMAQLAFNGSL